MRPITQDATREIIADFAKAIREKKRKTAKPSEAVIDFRNEKQARHTRVIEEVPLDLLRYRKENGRIASDVLNYEQLSGPLNETDDNAQITLRGFLEKKDPEKTEILLKSIQHSGQNEPAIITCDGFLINGNRRKMVLEKLRDKDRGNPNYHYMKVVILPGPNDDGGPPTLLDIERIENRYQLQSEGKSEYYGFDRALSIKRKIDLGFSLPEQLRDDPEFINSTEKELLRAVKKYEAEYLEPLSCIDRYLKEFGREGMYASVSLGKSDREGRWQAFIDYNKSYRTIADRSWQINNDLNEDDIGEIEDAAFKLIRLRVIPDMPKIHEVMRRLPKFCSDRDSRKELLRISRETEVSIPQKDQYDESGNPLSPEDIDKKWIQQNQKTIIYRAKKAQEFSDNAGKKETPLTLLEAAYKKLVHENLDVSSCRIEDLSKARELVANIQSRAGEIESAIYKYQKDWKKLPRKK
jgi:hypothetical protein